MKKAKVVYSGGYMLVIDKYNKSPLLLLEWLSRFNAQSNFLSHIENDSDSDKFKIRINVTKEMYNDCATYINDNL